MNIQQKYQIEMVNSAKIAWSVKLLAGMKKMILR